MSQRNARQPVHRPTEVVDAAGLRWPRVDDEAMCRLPPVLRAVVRALGWGRARDFLLNHGGLMVRLPMAAPKDDRLWLGLTGAEVQRLLVTLAPHLMTGQLLSLPKADKLFAQWRNEEFARDMHNLSIRDLARKYKITSRHVLNLKRLVLGLDDQPGTRPGQIGLF